MKKQITRISPMQTAKVLSIVQFFAFLPLFIFILIPNLMLPGRKQGIALVMLFLMPFIYLVFGFLFTLLGAWVYNKVANKFGGIEYTTNEVVENLVSSSPGIN